MSEELQILIVEDSEDDALLDLLQIKKGGYDVYYERVETAETFKAALNSKNWDIILSDYKMPHFNGLRALSLLKETEKDLPFIIISGTIGEEVAVEAMRTGAHDYIMKNNLQRLLPAVERELRESKSRAEKRLLEQKHKLAELERLSHLWFFESMDKINRAMQGAKNLEQMMTDVLDIVLYIFDCDRAFLLYPCDPEASSWHIPKERSRPEYPGVFAPGLSIPMDKYTAGIFRTVLDSNVPVQFGPGTDHPFSDDVRERYGFQSCMSTAIYPKTHKAWQFGIQQCSRSRFWNHSEIRLFQEISRRMADSLTSLLTHRELIESENRYRRITETLTDYQFSVRIENNRAVQTIQSPACKAVTGYTPEEFESDPFLWFKMVAPEDRELVQKRVNQIMAGEEIPPIEHRIIRKDGEIRWICDTTILFKDESGKLLSYDGVIKDITDRKKAEIEIARANRALRMLSDSNQALIHINDESELLNEVCRIVVEVGGYSLAWIGFLEYNDAKTLRPVAHAGNNSGYIEMANVSWGDNAQGQGPGGVSVRTGKPCVIRNISSDKSFSPWHEAAIQRGFKAIIALPLVYEGETFGTIGIYSQEQDEFDENEIEILKELSDDLSFGIASLRIRVQKSLAESALQVSEERFSAAFRYSPLAIAIFREADGYIVDVNEVFIKTSGYSRDEIIGHTTDELGLYANPADREKVMQLLKERGVVESFEFEGSNKSGERRNMLSAITYIIFNGEKHYLALILDITERKKSEEQLRILNTALEAAANAILVTDKNGIIIWTNKAFLKLTGYLLEEAIGHNPGELVNSGIHSNEFFENMWSTILSGNIWNGEIVNRRKDESLYNEYMTITPVLDKEKKITQFIAVKQDITEKKLAEIALLDSEKKYRIVADNTYNWEFWSDPEGKYIYCSPSCLRVTGYSEQEFFADPELSFKIVHTDYRSLFNEHILNSTKENNAINIQYKIIRKDGSERWIEHVCQPVFDDNGNYLGRRGSNSDITEKKEADRLILNAIISTEESERNRFSQELHDGLGPMLSTVKLYFQWLAETTNAKKQKNIAQTGLQNIDDAIQAVREISNNLSPRILVNFGLVPALKNLIHRINETKILNIDFKYDGEQRYISQIEATLYRIISELLNNTMKYAKAHNIFINLSHNLSKNRLEIVYTDDGKGFDFNKVLEKKSGMGIQNIIQRVATLDGIVNFNTKEGKPLFVNIELPIINKEQA